MHSGQCHKNIITIVVDTIFFYNTSPKVRGEKGLPKQLIIIINY